MNITINQTTPINTTRLQWSPPEAHRVNPLTTLCHHRRNLHGNLQSNVQFLMIVLFSVSGGFGIFSNMVVVFAIHKTKQMTIQSIKLFHVLSLISIFNSMTNLFRIKGVLFPYQSSCLYYYAIIFTFFLGVYSSFFMIVVVGLDRYLHITYLQNYSSVFTAKRFKLAITITLLMALYQASATVFSAAMNGPGLAGKYTIPLNALIAVSIIFFYTASLVHLRRRNRFVANTSFAQRRILRITCMYFYFYLANMLILLMYQSLLNWTDIFSKLTQGEKNLLMLSAVNVPTSICIIHAIAFLWINRKSREWLKSFFRSDEIVTKREPSVVPTKPVHLSILNCR